MAETLALTRLALGLVGGVVYVLVGRAVARRRTSPEGALAMRAFQVWWYGLATIALFAPMFELLDLVAGTGSLFPVRLYFLNIVLLLIIAAVGGLLYYLLYVYTGWRKVVWPVLAYCLLEAAWLISILITAHPVSHGPECPNGGFCYENEFSGTPTATWLSVSLVLPILLATVAYFGLYFKLDDPAQRRRVATVALALFVWFGSSLAASLVPLPGAAGDEAQAINDWRYWGITSALISLGAALMILWAYRDPAGARADD